MVGGAAKRKDEVKLRREERRGRDDDGPEHLQRPLEIIYYPIDRRDGKIEPSSEASNPIALTTDRQDNLSVSSSQAAEF